MFEIFLNLYIGLLFVVLVCSLGNRPQVSNLNQLKTIDSTELIHFLQKGSKWIYTISIFLFGICNVITTWCAGYTVYLAVPHTVAGWKDILKYVPEFWL